MPEPRPSAEILSLLDTNWDTGNVAEPTYVDVNESAAPRVDLTRGDYIIIRLGIPGETETLKDQWGYLDRINNVELELHTNVSRQRLYDLKAEVRRVIHSQVHSMTNWQVVRYKGFTEMTQEQLNVWTGRITISLENNGIPTES